MGLLQNIALKILGLSLDSAKLARKLEDSPTRRATALQILGIEDEDYLNVRKIKRLGGVQEFAKNVLKLPSLDSLPLINKWLKLTKEEKVEEMLDTVQAMADEGDSPRSFFTGVYTRYVKFKMRNGSKWKEVKSYKIYLTKLKSLADECIINDSMNLEQFHKGCIYMYFAFKLYLAGKVHKPEGQLVQMNTTLAKAA